MKLSRNFEAEELLSPDGLDQLARGNLMLQPNAIKMLQDFRDYVDSPVLVNHKHLELRGYRSVQEQLKLIRDGVTTAYFSRHIQGLAFDISVPKLSMGEFAHALFGFGEWPFIRRYPNFFHVDVRPVKDSEIGGQWV